MSHEHHGVECHANHGHEHHNNQTHHEHHRIVKGIGHACMEGTCGHIEHIGGIQFNEFQAIEAALMHIRELDNDNTQETPYDKKRKKKSKKHMNEYFRLKAA